MLNLTMTFRKISITHLLLILLLCKFINTASLSISDQKKYKNLIEGQGLFSVDDDVDILTIDNFKSELYGQKHAWLIEFYNSWCGFCQRFAPSWKALASDIRGWNNLIRIGAIDCTNEDNSPICRDFEVMSYPTLKYFHENYQEGPKNQGVIVTKGDDVNTHRKYLLEYIITEQNEGRAAIYPNLRPYNHPNLDFLFSEAPKGTQYVILIIAKLNETTGPEVAMDFAGVKHISIRYTYPNNTDLIYKKLKISKLPAVIVMSQDNKLQKFADGLKTRESMRMVIKDFLKPKNINVPKEEEAKTEIYTGKWQDAEVPDADSLFEAHQKKLLKDKIKKMKDPVFQMDLETALRWSLKREIARVKTIEGEKLQALIAYLNVIVKYFPFGLNGQKFLIELRDHVVNSGENVEGKAILQMIKDAERKDEKLFSSPENWLACEGSSPEHRGYPCGLWKMFHYLTVNAAEKSVDNSNPLEVLRAMEGYIRNFFGCADCAQHFLEMVEKKDMKGVGSLDSSVLWLWMAHNAANKRLAGDETEDPEHPKMQFPSVENCPQCKTADNSWDFNEVLRYMKQVYSSINVRYIGSDTRVLHSALENPVGANSGGFFHKLDAKRLPEKALRS